MGKLMVCVIQKILIGKMHQIGSKFALFARLRGFAARGVMSMRGRLESTNICANLMVHSWASHCASSCDTKESNGARSARDMFPCFRQFILVGGCDSSSFGFPARGSSRILVFNMFQWKNTCHAYKCAHALHTSVHMPYILVCIFPELNCVVQGIGGEN